MSCALAADLTIARTLWPRCHRGGGSCHYHAAAKGLCEAASGPPSYLRNGYEENTHLDQLTENVHGHEAIGTGDKDSVIVSHVSR